VSLAYVVPVEGDCAPQQDALELTWFTPQEARDPAVLAELIHGQSTPAAAGAGAPGRLTVAPEGRHEHPSRAGRRPQAISGTRR
jgi:hypothetical protein